MNELDRKGPMTEMTAAQSRNLHVGIDIGSTTVKAVVLDADTNEELFGVYRRHGSQQIQATLRVLDEIVARFPFAKRSLRALRRFARCIRRRIALSSLAGKTRR